MRSKFLTLLTVIGAVTVLVLAANTVALATTGKAILAGKINTSTKLTTIVRTTPGTGLQVKTKSTANAPFAVNGKGKVANLNADSVDGLDSSKLKTTGYGYTIPVSVATTSLNVGVPLPAGNYQLSYSAYLPGASGDTDCWFKRTTTPSTTTTYFGEARFTENTVAPGLSGTGFVNVSAGVAVLFHCDSNTSFSTSPGEEIQIIAVRLDSLNPSTQLSPMRHAARSVTK